MLEYLLERINETQIEAKIAETDEERLAVLKKQDDLINLMNILAL